MFKIAFKDNFIRNTGVKFTLQQIKGLVIKRFRIFFRRFILASLILLFPLFAEAILSAIIPSQTNKINSILGINANNGSNFLNLSQYGLQTVPYFATGTNSTVTSLLVKNTFGNTSNINLFSLESDTINSYVLSLRSSSLKSFINNYFVGLSINLTNGTLSSTLYYSSLAFHSSASVLNQMSNMLLDYLTNDTSYSITSVNSPINSDSSLANSTDFLELLACFDTVPLTLINFINAVIVAFVISILVMHVSRERLNGSKQLQLLSGTNYITYWISNYIFDLFICLFIASTMVLMLKLVDLIKNDPSSETAAIASSNSLGYFYLLMLFSMFAWCSMAYVWSFCFKSDLIGFIILFILLAFLAFIDAIFIFVQLILVNNNPNPNNGGLKIFSALRFLLMLIFPNLTIKRGLYNLKIRGNSYCIDKVNEIFYSKLKNYLFLLLFYKSFNFKQI